MAWCVIRVLMKRSTRIIELTAESGIAQGSETRFYRHFTAAVAAQRPALQHPLHIFRARDRLGRARAQLEARAPAHRQPPAAVHRHQERVLVVGALRDGREGRVVQTLEDLLLEYNTLQTAS